MSTVKRNALPWLWLSTLLIVVDQWTKAMAVGKLAYQQPVPLIPGFWNWTLTHNFGAAFSLLANAGEWRHWFFVVLAFLISGGLVLALARTARGDWRNALPFALVIAGALGNLVDRLRLGYVIDFIQWYWQDFYWPVFNVADSCIVVGAVLIVVFSLFSGKRG
jgi:signal peptidase II